MNLKKKQVNCSNLNQKESYFWGTGKFFDEQYLNLNGCTLQFWEATTKGILQQMIFLENSQHLQENTCTRVSFLLNY